MLVYYKLIIYLITSCIELLTLLQQNANIAQIIASVPEIEPDLNCRSDNKNHLDSCELYNNITI